MSKSCNNLLWHCALFRYLLTF